MNTATPAAAAKAGPPLSPFRKAGNLLFVSGQLPRGPSGAIVEGDIAVQSEVALGNLLAVLERAGSGVQDVVKVTVWLTDPADADGFNQVYRRYFAEPFPARSVVVSGLVAPGALLEIEATAVLG
jgi:2-iminobutanoate/2-iminopropanoate deaminase